MRRERVTPDPEREKGKSKPVSNLDAQLKGKCVHLVGVSSLEIADVAVWLADAKDTRLVGHDLCAPDMLAEHFRAAHVGMPREERERHWSKLEAADIELRLGEDYLTGIDEAEVVVASQAWRLYEANEPLQRVLQSGVFFVTPIEIYLSVARTIGLRTVGVTGSNGKSTTVNMIAAILEAACHPHVLAGNYRYRGPILGDLRELPSHGVLALEISNHHLLALKQGVDVAVVTNVTENHLEEHDGFEDYVRVKRSLVEAQPDGATAILNADDQVSSAFCSVARGPVMTFSVEQTTATAFLDCELLKLRPPGEFVHGPSVLLHRSQLVVPGLHNVQNALAAALAAWSIGCDGESITRGLASFSGIKGRLEHVRTVGSIAFYYDVESTTPESTIRGLQAFPDRHVHLIVGGENKGLSYRRLAQAIGQSGAVLHLLPGSASQDLERHAREFGVLPNRAKDLEKAVREAFISAPPRAVVLLSPGARGFYNQFLRDKPSFARLVKRLKARQRTTRDTAI